MAIVETKSTTAAQKDGEGQRRPLTPAAERALAEAEERRRLAADRPGPPHEQGGRVGPDPTRFGDWEKDGLISDF